MRLVSSAQAWVWSVMALVGMILVGGCGGPPLPPLTTVKGTVKVDGQSITSGQISLLPVTVDKDKKVPPSSGQISSDGTYEIFTGGKPGAPEGKYKVTVSPSMVPMEGAKGMPKAPFHDKYRQPNSTTLQITVPGDYDLKLTK